MSTPSPARSPKQGRKPLGPPILMFGSAKLPPSTTQTIQPFHVARGSRLRNVYANFVRFAYLDARPEGEGVMIEATFISQAVGSALLLTRQDALQLAAKLRAAASGNATKP